MSASILTPRSLILIFSSFLMGGVLMLLRLPTGLDWLGPLWLVLILLCWVLKVPQYVNVGTACLVGLILDVVYNVAIGGHSLALISVVYFMTKFRHKMTLLNIWNWKISVIVAGFIGFYQFLLFLMQLYLGGHFDLWLAIRGIIASLLAWPLLAFLLFNYQQKLRI